MRICGFFLLLILSPYTWGQSSSTEGDSWEYVQKAKRGSIVVYWYETKPFIWNEAGQMTGIEYEILDGFKQFVKSKYKIDLTLRWEEGKSFESTYQTVRDEKRKGVLGASTFSITPERKTEIGFSPPYMPDITVLISSKNIPIVKDVNEFDKIFPKLEAVTIRGTTLEKDLLSVKASRKLNFKIQYQPNADNVLYTIQHADSLFGFVSLPIYLIQLNGNSKLNISRQNLFPIQREGYAFIYPKESDWDKPLQAYFASVEFQSLTKKIIDQYFNNNVYEFIENLFYHANEVMLLSREKEIQKRDLEEKSKQIQEDSIVRSILITAILLFLGLLMIIYTLYWRGRNANNTLRQQKEKIEKQRLELEKKNDELVYLNDEKNSLIKILAHDLRSPINQVRGLTEIFLSENKSLLPSQVEPINKIIDTTIRLNAMIGKILDVEAIEGKRINMTFEPINVSNLMRRIVSSFEETARQKNIKIDLQVDSDDLTITGDSVFMTEIIENLLSNALKFSAAGKKVSIGIIADAAIVKMFIKDEGPGFTAEDKEKLFQKFQRLSAKPTAGEPSTGLGLAIVKKYTDLMNGKVWFKSEAGQGATFYIEFPKSVS